MNENIRIVSKELLSGNWYKLWKYTYEMKQKDGEWLRQTREHTTAGMVPPSCCTTRPKAL